MYETSETSEKTLISKACASLICTAQELHPSWRSAVRHRAKTSPWEKCLFPRFRWGPKALHIFGSNILQKDQYKWSVVNSTKPEISRHGTWEGWNEASANSRRELNRINSGHKTFKSSLRKIGSRWHQKSDSSTDAWAPVFLSFVSSCVTMTPFERRSLRCPSPHHHESHAWWWCHHEGTGCKTCKNHAKTIDSAQGSQAEKNCVSHKIQRYPLGHLKRCRVQTK